MPRKSENGPEQTPTDKAGSNLKGLRSQIDKLDLQILELLNKRASIAGQIEGKVKAFRVAEVFSAAALSRRGPSERS